jgi:hypothetical protein
MISIDGKAVRFGTVEQAFAARPPTLTKLNNLTDDADDIDALAHSIDPRAKCSVSLDAAGRHEDNLSMDRITEEA